MDVAIVGDGDDLVGAQAPAPEHRPALADRDRCVVALPGSDRHETAPGELGIDVELFVARIDRLGVRRNPHLHEMHVASVPESFISLCQMPVPADIRCASPG